MLVCPGDDFLRAFPRRIAAYGLTRCKLHMMRLAPRRLCRASARPVMSDLGLVRYLGYAELPEAAALQARGLQAEQGEHLANGVHLIVGAERRRLAGRRRLHHYAATPDPFAPDRVDELILDEFAPSFGAAAAAVRERWTGTYASAPDRADAGRSRRRTVCGWSSITSGTGASTSFAIAEEVIDDLFG